MEHSKFSFNLLSIFFVLNLSVSCVNNPDNLNLDTSNSDIKNEAVEPKPIKDNPTEYKNIESAISDLASNSKCSSYSWLNRGRGPSAYIRGMAITFARSYCRLNNSKGELAFYSNIISKDNGDSSIDALSHYAKIFDQKLMKISKYNDETLRSLYTLGIGLGMRESSGKYCEGNDTSSSNYEATTAEAGLFQSSYNSISTSLELTKLYEEYKNSPEKCLLNIFSSNVTCTPSRVIGAGAGADYQSFNKSCPAFATEYAMLVLRLRRKHYGPINRLEAEVVPECNQMLKSVQTLIDEDIYACAELSL